MIGILHTIFFHRFFPVLTPRTRDVLDLSLPFVDDDELETMIDQRVAALERQLDADRSGTGSGVAAGTAASNGGGRGQLAVQFFEKRRRKAWLSRGDDEVCWERWTVKVTVAEPKTESGACHNPLYPFPAADPNAAIFPKSKKRNRDKKRKSQKPWQSRQKSKLESRQKQENAKTPC